MESRDFPLSLETKRAIFQVFFGCSIDLYPSSLYESYICYYQITVERSRPSGITSSHRAIIALVQLLKSPDVTRAAVENALQKQLLSSSQNGIDGIEEIIKDAINLGTRLLLMTSTGTIRSIGHSLTVSGGDKLCWMPDDSLSSMIAKRFDSQKDISRETNVKLEKIFNARNLERIGGIEIRWTSNLADHLRMRDDDTAVEIFHYASFLAFHRDGPNIFFPPALIQETLQTLALLLPELDPTTKTWYAHQSTRRHSKRASTKTQTPLPPLDPLARENGQLKASARQIAKFPYWSERLVVLKQVFDEAEPMGVRQWWWDRRRRVQWYTFWVAAMVLVLTVFFGVVQSVEGALQVWLAWRALRSV